MNVLSRWGWLGLAWALTGCGGQQASTEAEGAAGVIRAASGSPVGRWVAERHQLVLGPKGWFSWERPLPCELPPCKTRYSEGRYVLKGANRIQLIDKEGRPRDLVYRLTPDGHLRFKQANGGEAYELSSDL